MITYTRQEDGTYVKAGEFAAVPASVRIQIDDAKPFAGDYTLAQATEIIEDALRKNQMKKQKYSIILNPEKVKKVKEPKAPREKKVKEPKAPRVAKYDVQQFATIYKNTSSLEDVVKATGASRAYAHRALVKLGLYVKPATVAKPEVALTPEEETRIAEILATFTETVVGNPRKLAIKQLHKEQRAANKAVNAEPKAPRVLKYSVQQFAEIYAATKDVNQIVIQTGASKVYAIRALTKLGLYEKRAVAPKVETPVVPAEAAPVAPVEAAPVAEAAPVEAKPAKAKKSKPQQEQPPVEVTTGKKGKKS